MQNIHGKEIDLLRTTVKVPGKRLPRATPATAPGTSPRANGLALERSNTQLGGGTGEVAAGGAGGERGCFSLQDWAVRLWRPPKVGALGLHSDPAWFSGLQTRLPPKCCSWEPVEGAASLRPGR